MFHLIHTHAQSAIEVLVTDHAAGWCVPNGLTSKAKRTHSLCTSGHSNSIPSRCLSPDFRNA